MSVAVALILGLAVLIGWVRLGRWQLRAPVRAGAGRMAALMGLQALAAALLYLALFPPAMGSGAATLVVATGGARGFDPAATVVLPEVVGGGGERVPDLATALRRHPGTRALRILGDGLGARDRPAAAGLAIAFDPPPRRRGIVGLQPPAPPVPGAPFSVGVTVAGVRDATVELIDPAGRLVDRVMPGSDGRAMPGGTAREAGAALFTVRVYGAGRKLVETAAVPVVTVAPPPVRVAIVAGAPGPEVKFLRRWATDAGLATTLRLPVGGGVALGDAGPLTAATLGRTDLLAVDDRGWAALSPGERQAAMAAVRSGMGVLLRVTGPVPPRVRADWRALGLDVAGGQATAAVALAPAAPGEEALRARRGPGGDAAARDDLPGLTRRVVAVTGAVPLLRDARGQLLAGWRASGRGRAGVWLVDDSFALVTVGHGDRHAEWWSAIASALARADARVVPRLDPLPVAGQRMAICGVQAGPVAVDGPDGRHVTPLVDPRAGCAGYWPVAAGWHRLRTGDGVERPFHVQPAKALPALRAAERSDATAAMAGGIAAEAGDGSPIPGSSWPWLAGWLAAAALLWWLERRRRR